MPSMAGDGQAVRLELPLWRVLEGSDVLRGHLAVDDQVALRERAARAERSSAGDEQCQGAARGPGELQSRLAECRENETKRSVPSDR